MPEKSHSHAILKLSSNLSNVDPTTFTSNSFSLAIMQFFGFENVETIHQRCVLIRGRTVETETSHVLVNVKDALSEPVAQTWPATLGYFKALVMLSPGKNTIDVQSFCSNMPTENGQLILDYVPLLQLPPLHLAIMIAKDSPLQMDCPTWKSAFTSAHSGLDAAVTKLRTTAYMWQAMTAEDMHSKGVGRRSFRLDEEWALDTTTASSMRTRRDRKKLMRSMARVHLVRSERTIAELHGDRTNGNDVHKYFGDALKTCGGVLDSSGCPIVAGLIFDTQFDPDRNRLHGFSDLGTHNPNGLSLGVFGSHLTYSWPRFFDEIPSCLTDTTPPGETVYNQDNECSTAWEACAISQGAFLHSVGHAFGAQHSTGIMGRDHSHHWARNFLSATAYCAANDKDGAPFVDEKDPNDARWSVEDTLRFHLLPHFRLPGDPILPDSAIQATPCVRPVLAEEDVDDEDGDVDSDIGDGLIIECPAGISRVDIPGISIPINNTVGTRTHMIVSLNPLPRDETIPVYVLGCNGREFRHPNVWKLLQSRTYIRIPNSSIRLRKQAVGFINDTNHDSDSDSDDSDSDSDMADEDQTSADDVDGIEWAFLLTEKGPNGNLTRATSVVLCVGATMDGSFVRYADGHTTNCGPALRRDGSAHRFGGGRAEVQIPEGVDVAKVEINAHTRWGNTLDGIRVTLSNGDVADSLRMRNDRRIQTLEPAPGEKIVGFCGKSESHGGGFCMRFGIITAPSDEELPSQTYDMVELRNNDSRIS
jgi:hypothetical protein